MRVVWVKMKIFIILYPQNTAYFGITRCLLLSNPKNFSFRRILSLFWAFLVCTLIKYPLINWYPLSEKDEKRKVLSDEISTIKNSTYISM
jgi:hypothetical protein